MNHSFLRLSVTSIAVALLWQGTPALAYESIDQVFQEPDTASAQEPEVYIPAEEDSSTYEAPVFVHEPVAQEYPPAPVYAEPTTYPAEPVQDANGFPPPLDPNAYASDPFGNADAMYQDPAYVPTVEPYTYPAAPVSEPEATVTSETEVQALPIEPEPVQEPVEPVAVAAPVMQPETTDAASASTMPWAVIAVFALAVVAAGAGLVAVIVRGKKQSVSVVAPAGIGAVFVPPTAPPVQPPK
jgi:hypothetical protein